MKDSDRFAREGDQPNAAAARRREANEPVFESAKVHIVRDDACLTAWSATATPHVGREAQAPEHSDLLSLIEMVEGFKQSIAALVTGLVSDGFSDEQARDIVAGFWRITGRPEEKS